MSVRSCNGRVLALVLVAALASACQPDPGEKEQDFRANVAVSEVRRGPVQRALTTTGSVRAKREARLQVETSGKLVLARGKRTGERLAVGDAVERGQVVAVVAALELSTSARLVARRQALDAALAELRRNQALFAEGLVSELRVEEVQTRVASARADLDQGLLQEQKGRLTSPIDGFLSKVTTAADGETLSPGHVVAEILGFDEVLVDLDLASSEALAVRPGMLVRVRPYATGEAREGRIERLAPAVDPTSRTLRAEVLVPNADFALRPGMFVRAEVVLEARADVVVVPTDSLETRDGRTVVFVAAPGPVARLREVEVGLVQEDVTEIRSGLDAGERIVVSGQRTLADGTRLIERSRQ